eukprot:TRINITY_DN15679_c0_g1_i1.p1 TRINITY_DN15679_c0_g1~~TRINITY_DN15679_c0_g1_i1.p1  ORF type:complete len:123 (+),score=23.98 TRINITY_DN15679_c0_g1_i1:210-578(+)
MALHRLDGVQYAIKQIKFSNVGFTSLIHRKVLREVKNLARLDHPNICRYYNAWIEPIWDEQRGPTHSARVVEISSSTAGSSETISGSLGIGDFQPLRYGEDLFEKYESGEYGDADGGATGGF